MRCVQLRIGCAVYTNHVRVTDDENIVEIIALKDGPEDVRQISVVIGGGVVNVRRKLQQAVDRGRVNETAIEQHRYVADTESRKLIRLASILDIRHPHACAI